MILARGGGIRLTPAQRDAAVRAIARTIVWISERMGIPPWGGVLIVTGLFTAGGAVYVFWPQIVDWISR